MRQTLVIDSRRQRLSHCGLTERTVLQVAAFKPVQHRQISCRATLCRVVRVILLLGLRVIVHTNLDWCFVCLCSFHKADDLSKDRLGANTCRAHVQKTRAVDCAPNHSIARLLCDLHINRTKHTKHTTSRLSVQLEPTTRTPCKQLQVR
jgi:hypothetical protein